MLIFDGHGSHTTSDIIRHCILNRIQIALLPPHSSHLTQPLDVRVFSSMKAHMTQEMHCIIRMGVPRIQKIEWLDAFITAHKLSFTIQNILSGWSGTGLHPFNPQKVLQCVPVVTLIETPPHKMTPIFANPLDNPELNSSPVETLAMNAANNDIKWQANNQSSEIRYSSMETHHPHGHCSQLQPCKISSPRNSTV